MVYELAMFRNNPLRSLSCTTMSRCCRSCSVSACITLLSVYLRLLITLPPILKPHFVFKTNHYHFSVFGEGIRRRYTSLTHTLLDTHPFTNLTTIFRCRSDTCPRAATTTLDSSKNFLDTRGYLFIFSCPTIK